MADEPDKHLAWVIRIFGSVEAYLASLPRCVWVEGEAGWVSYHR
jgi:hypothetical protein